MSTKTKASSKKVKAAPKKATKKVAVKKVNAKASVKVAAKAKKTVKPVKKAVAKPVASSVSKSKKVVKPVKKVATKKIVVKKKAVAVAPKKVVKSVKKVTPKKVVKPIAKAVAKKVIAKAKPLKKAAPKKVVAKAVVKPVKPIVVKAPKVKVEKPIKAIKEKAPVVRKPIVAPTTFRNNEPTAPVNTKILKEPAGKFEMEFVIRASEDMVFEFVSTESGLSEWFCDDVNIRDGVFTFNWDGQIQQAKLIKEIPPISIRYQWLDKNDGSYFEFKTQKDELTNDISLIITDFASDKADEVSARLLWASQVDKLLHVLGSFF